MDIGTLREQRRNLEEEGGSKISLKGSYLNLEIVINNLNYFAILVKVISQTSS